MPGCGMDPERWLGARVLLAMLLYVPITGFKPKRRMQSPRLQMQTAILGCIATNLDFIRCQQELKAERVVLIAFFNCWAGAATDSRQHFKNKVFLSHFSGCHSGSTSTSIKTDSGWFVGCK